MKSILRFAIIAFTSVLFYTCNSASEESSKEESVDALLGTPFTRTADHDTCLFIAHEVKEYDFWKATFDLAASVRSKNGLHTLDVYQELSNPNRTLVMTSVEDLQKAKTYITSEDLKVSMEGAGVTSEMELYWLHTTLSFTKEITDTIPMFMSFNVVSYDRWEEAFLADFKENPNYDFQVLKVFRGVESPGQVSMLFAVNDPEYVEKKEKDNAFRMKMLAAGVISYPVTYKLKPMQV